MFLGALAVAAIAAAEQQVSAVRRARSARARRLKKDLEVSQRQRYAAATGRVLMAGMNCVRPGRETRLIYRTQTYRGRTGEKTGFRAREFADLLASARRQLDGAPLIVVWDNASTHHAKALREFCERNSKWLTIVKLPPYAPDLNRVEGVWAHLKKSLANLAPRTIDDLTPLVKNRLRAIQRRPQILVGFIAETGLGLEPP
ncbi:transposase [Streptomyces sp. NPDC059442]|uniref:transposase n=1 Tax=Streptomyces sp. NPDC059442 TaxID=3346830 RepID=UPI0036B16587